MITLNPITFTQVINSAKLAAAGDSRWLNAIERAARELEMNPYIERDGDHLLIASSTSGNLYAANGVCQCVAYQHNQPCWHRAAGRLVQRYDEAEQRIDRAARQKAAQDALDEVMGY